MFQHVILCVAAFWIQRNTTLSTEKPSFFLDIFSHTHSTFLCWRFITFCGWNMDQIVILLFPIKPARGVIFWGTFWWSRFRCSTRILYKRSLFVPAALLSLKWRCLWISLNLFLDIVCENIRVWKIPLVDQYNSNYGFRTIPVTKFKPRNFFISITVTGFHSSLRSCFVTGWGIFAICCCAYKFVCSTAISMSLGGT